MTPALSRNLQRWLFFLGTFLSGFASLVYQVVWQRYLAILIGSEAKSSAIVISVFLVGLALGYFFFGRLMERNWTRRFSLKFYGYVELATALYAISFPMLFPLFKAVSFSGANNIVFDIFVVSLCLLFPTFLMGGSIPVLTKVLPESPEEVNEIHARIYGWNTLGACLGVLIGGFYLIPRHGLPVSLLFAGVTNLLLSFIFLANRLTGEAHQNHSVKPLPNHLKSWQIYFLVFVVGLVTISFEVVLMRLVGLSIGSSNLVFPTVLSIFIFGLGYGSLRLPQLKSSAGLYRRLTLILGLWFAVFLTVPYWGFWAAHIKFSLADIDSNFFVYNVLTLLLFALFIFPPVYFMGQILPLAYSLLDKSGKDYGKKCGFLYSFNTLGTALGGVVLGYLFLYFMDLDGIFRLNVLLLGGTAVWLSFLEKSKTTLVLSGLLSVLILFPQWNRSGHHMGFFRDQTEEKEFFQGLFHLPAYTGDAVLHHSDGPNSSITVTGYGPEVGGALKDMMEYLGLTRNVSMLVNGKSDGDILGDFSNMYLTGAIPYFFANGKENMKAAMIGFGTGLSLGTLEQSEKISNIDLIEISSELLKVRHKTEGSNFQADQGPKTSYINNDAFRFFTRTQQAYDIIVTEPSNPWVTGVENIFTSDFFMLARKKLRPDGVLGVWFQRYNSHVDIIAGVMASIAEVFPHFRVYQIGSGDSLILASPVELNGPFASDRVKETFHNKVLSALKIEGTSDLQNLLTLSEGEMAWAASKNKLGRHSLEFPKLSDLANKYRFFHSRAETRDMVEEDLRVLLRTQDQKNRLAFEKSLENKERFQECPLAHGFQFYCHKMNEWIKRMDSYQSGDSTITGRKVMDYLALRSYGLVERNQELEKVAMQSLPALLSRDPRNSPPWMRPLILISLLEGRNISEVQNLTGFSSWPETIRNVEGPILQEAMTRVEFFKGVAGKINERRGLTGASTSQ